VSTPTDQFGDPEDRSKERANGLPVTLLNETRPNTGRQPHRDLS
jgi:hypothetical protein